MPSRETVLRTLERTGSYEGTALHLGIPAGQAFLIATGLPADGGDTFPPDELDRPGMIPQSSQALVYRHAEPENPTTKGHVHEWIKRRADADQPMRRAADARDAAPGKILDPDETDICTVLTRDHDQVTAMLKQIKTIPGPTTGGSAVHLSRKKSIVDMVTVALSQHESAEQEHFWPAVRSLFKEGEDIVADALEQEQHGKDLLHRLGETPATDPEFDELCEQLDKACRAHVAYEDRVLLALRGGMDMDERRRLGEKVRTAEQHAPTRPHPHASKEPAIAVKAAGAAAAAMDKVRDTVGERPADRRGKAAQDVRAGEGAYEPSARNERAPSGRGKEPQG